ncbi:hypothetical protein B7463_g7030, partial [Scytalidium lignicola]
MIPPTGPTTDGGNPQHSSELIVTDYPPEMLRRLHDPNVSFEEYPYYARESRAWENSPANMPTSDKRGIKDLLKKVTGKTEDNGEIILGISPTDDGPNHATGAEKPPLAKVSPHTDNDGIVTPTRTVISNEEWNTAARATRTATWGAMFYLLTTDIIGPFSVPWAMAQTGYGPGIALYTVFGSFAGYTGWQLWTMFLDLDSDRYPLKTYGDVAYRVFGPWARHCVNVLQSIQILCIVSGVVLSGGQGIAQISKNSICYILCIFIFAIAGMIVGQVRTLRRFGWLANFGVFINLMICFIVMGVAAHSEPNYAAAAASYSIPKGPVITNAGTPPGTTFVTALNGLNQAVYSYGGSMMYCEFMSEMRKPMDFWKGLICAQTLIYCCYVTFGAVVYSFQGQFAFNPAMQGLSPYNWQTAVNIMFLFAGLISACLYSNIGIKVLYINIFEELFNAPPLTTRKGKLFWVALVPVYWAVAFVFCSAIPQFSYISGLVGAVCILQFTYTFPPILMLGFQVKKDAILPQEIFDPITKSVTRLDSGIKRWSRGFMKNWHINSFNIFFALGAATTAVLGIYSSIISLIAAFDGISVATSFGCTAPV